MPTKAKLDQDLAERLLAIFRKTETTYNGRYYEWLDDTAILDTALELHPKEYKAAKRAYERLYKRNKRKNDAT